MKSLLMASVSLAVGTLICLPATANGQAGGDSVAGAGRDCLAFDIPPVCARRASVDVEVESGPTGEHPAGTVSWSNADLFLIGLSSFATTHATCLSVSGRVAIIGVTGSVMQGHRYDFVESPIAGLARIVDAGGPDSGADNFQFAIQVGPINGPPLPGPTKCSTFPGTFPTGSSFFPRFTNETGDVVVTDTRPLPTSKDQCKKGGWQSYGVFRNQGDCVSFVATGGKNPPGGKTG
jgi:hypothetical protein